METVTTYIADDGMQFNDEQACIAYENSIKRNRKKINNAISTLKEYCNNTRCSDCFAGKSYYGHCGFRVNDPEEWEMKMD